MSQLSKYRVIRPIGSGNFGKVKCKVYLVAQHLLTGAQVALKVLNKKHIKEQNAYSRIKSEVRILRKLHHPHIISLYDVISTSKNLILVTQYLPGGQLYNLIQKNRLSEEVSNNYFQQIIFALDYCHKHSVSHRDIKPENLLLDIYGDLKIADFGLSSLIRDGEFLKTSCGSPNYAPPEIISGNKYWGPEVDVWSTGVVLYALVAGSLPFDECSISALFTKIKLGRFDTPFHFSAELRDLIYRMLDPDPVSRITIAQIKKHPWFNISYPLYVRPPTSNYRQDIDQEILFQVIRFSNNTKPLQEYKRAIIENELDQATVTYRIMLDAKKRVQEHVEIFQHPNFIPVTQSTRHSKMREFDRLESKIPHNWVYGFRSVLTPIQFMSGLLQALRKFGCEWKFILTYKMKIRNTRAALKFWMEVFIYRETYVLDFRYQEGMILMFLDLVSQIYLNLFKLNHF